MFYGLQMSAGELRGLSPGQIAQFFDNASDNMVVRYSDTNRFLLFKILRQLVVALKHERIRARECSFQELAVSSR